MPTPPLQLERSFYDQLSLSAIPEHERGKGGYEVQTTVQLQAGDSGRRWLLSLTIATKAKPGPPPPYEIHLKCNGFFSVPVPKENEEETARLVGVTGSSMLYSAAREYVLLLTSRGPWGPLQLPTTSFFNISFIKLEKTKTRKNPKSTPKSPGKKGRGQQEK